MEPILIFRHVTCEGPGYLARFLDARGLPWRMVRIDAGEPVPTTLEDAAALVFMGGPMSVNDPLPWIAGELRLIREAAQAGLPVLGHCLGGQLIARALGAPVAPMAAKEIGWFEVQAADTAAAREWLGAKAFTAFHWHGEAFELPQGATRILGNEHCPNQGFVYEGMLALQCHVEMTAEMVREWAEVHGAELEPSAPRVQGRSEMLDRLEGRVGALQRAADRLYGRWLEGWASPRPRQAERVRT